MSQIICVGLQPIVIEKHFKDLQRRYGDVLAIDLINQVYHILKIVLLCLCG